MINIRQIAGKPRPLPCVAGIVPRGGLFRPRKWRRLILALMLWIIAATGLHAADPLARREWIVDGVSREALVYFPSRTGTNAAPVVFAFHGHGGTMRHAARSFSYQSHWPEAVVVYMQGLKTPGKLTDPEGKKPGWQHAAGDHGDRDLKFFDAVLASLKSESRVDAKRVYATGHSNGGAFTYLLWAARGDRFAAVAPSAAVAAKNLAMLRPKPVLHVAGENDQLVKFAWQKHTLDALLKLNDCGKGGSWAKDCTLYESKAGAPVVAFIHPGTHTFPEAAPALIVRFFQEHAQP
jgi:polyhydroxybutyrate depolymerase